MKLSHRAALLHVAECPTCFRLLLRVVLELVLEQEAREVAATIGAPIGDQVARGRRTAS